MGLEKKIKEMETPKERAKMNEWIEEYIAKERVKSEVINSMTSSTDYVKWLIQFTQDKGDFYDDNWDYSDEKLGDIDKKMVDKLSLFFECINLYAKNNYIYSISRPLGECYQIKINNNGFEIGYITGQGTSFYCKKIQLDDEKDFIDFMDIVNNKKQGNVEYIEKGLNNLSNVLIDLYDNGVPIEAIIKTFDLFIRHINNIEREKNKVKKKIP